MKFVNNENDVDKREIEELDKLQSELAANAKPVEPEKPTPVKTSRYGKVNRVANLRKVPNPTSEIVDVLPIGARIDILGTDRNYFKATYRSHTGYILKTCVDEIW